jgi:benzoyl-CoA reductase/2-hydroxyglutaryl-CoA dehydratase subunit BcrC/BadD/HgdB
MAQKIYTYKGNTFGMRDNDLELLKYASPVLVKYRKLLYEYTNDIDMSALDTHRQRLDQFKTAVSQLQELLKEIPENIEEEDIENEQNKSKYTGEIERLTKLLNETQKEFDNDIIVQKQIRLYNECEGFVILNIISDIQFIKPILKNILTGDFRLLDFNDPGIIDFIREVVIDFFLIIARNKSLFRE